MPNSPLQPPHTRPGLPTYPVHLQLLRVTAQVVTGPVGFAQVAGSSVLGPMLHVAFVQQLRDDGSLLPRDREPCLADSVAGVPLTPGFYLGRLAGSWTSLPVYEVVGVGGTATYPSGTTTTWLPGSVISNDAIETYTPSYTGTYSGGSIVTYNAGSTLNVGGYFYYGASTATITGTVNNFANPTTGQVTITSATSTPILNGIVAPADTTRAQVITLVNDSGASITVNNNSGSATAGGAITTGTGAAVTWADGTSLMLEYNPTVGGYVVVGGTAVTGGGTTPASSWVLVRLITHADLTDADTSQDIDAYTLPAKTPWEAVMIHTKTVGSGGGVTLLDMNVLINGSTATVNTGKGLLSDNVAAQGHWTDFNGKVVISWTATTSIGVRFTSDVNVADLTGGEWEVWLQLGTAFP